MSLGTALRLVSGDADANCTHLSEQREDTRGDNWGEWATGGFGPPRRIRVGPEGGSAIGVDLIQQLVLMETMEDLAQVGSWHIDLLTGMVTTSPGIYKVFEVDPSVQDTLAEAQSRALPEYQPILQRDFDQAVAEGRPYNTEMPFRTGTGRVIWVRSIGMPEVRDGVTVAVRGVLVDITDEHAAREQVQLLNAELEQRVADRTASLAAANADLESFSYSVSHDLRSPLRAIAAFANLIDSRFRPELDPKVQHYLDNIITASDRMSALIEDLLDYSHLGRELPSAAEINLDRIIDSVIETLAEPLAATDGRVLTDGSLPAVRGNHTLVQQILVNLIDNALKYQTIGSLPSITVSARKIAGQVEISVSDNGIGIAPEYHEKIFEVFQRLHTDSEYPGTGIGLASARKAAERMGGTVNVTSELGRGSIFTVVLPGAGSA